MRVFAALLILAACAATPAAAQWIGIAPTADCPASTTTLCIDLWSQGVFYVRAWHPPLPPVLGAEFRITGLPPGWLVTSIVPNIASNLVQGDLFGRGVQIAFPTDQPGDCVDLFTVHVLATSVVSDVELGIAAHDPPSNPNHDCPLLVYSCPPCSESCVGTVSMIINPTGSCQVAVENSTWSRVRGLYTGR